MALDQNENLYIGEIAWGRVSKIAKGNTYAGTGSPNPPKIAGIGGNQNYCIAPKSSCGDGGLAVDVGCTDDLG